MSRAGRLKALLKTNDSRACGLGPRATAPNAATAPTTENRKGNEPRLTWALLRGLRLRRPASGPNIFVCNCPLGTSEETQHRMTVRVDERRGYRVYLVNCFPTMESDGGHAEPENYDTRIAEILGALGLAARDLYAQTQDRCDGPCEIRLGTGRRARRCGGKPAHRIDVTGLQHYLLAGLGSAPCLCLRHAAEVTETAAVLWPEAT